MSKGDSGSPDHSLSSPDHSHPTSFPISSSAPFLSTATDPQPRTSFNGATPPVSALSKFSFRRAIPSPSISKPPPPKKDVCYSYWVSIATPATSASSPEDSDVQKGFLEMNVTTNRLLIMTISGRDRVTAIHDLSLCTLLSDHGGAAEFTLKLKLPAPVSSNQTFVFDDEPSMVHFMRSWPGRDSKSAPPTPMQAPKHTAEGKTTVMSRAEEIEQKSISSTHHAFELTYDMMLGIRTTVSRTEGKPRGDLTLQDMLTTVRLKFPAKGSRTTPAHGMSDFYFKDYAPEVFRRIRSLSGIDPGNYLNEVCGEFQYLEFQSNSKSGEFFFFSHNRHFMIKTISHQESMILQAMLQSYYVHLNNSQDSLLIQFYGMHKVRPANQTKPYYFLIMRSIFHTDLPIHAIFDLKGSSLGRSASKEDKERGECVFKDNDFLEQSITLQLGPERAKRLLIALEKDVALMRDMNIMDYSLLIGIHYSGKHPKNKGNQRRSISVHQLSQMRTGTLDEDDPELDDYDRHRAPTIVRGSIRPVDLGFTNVTLPPDLPHASSEHLDEPDPEDDKPKDTAKEDKKEDAPSFKAGYRPSTASKPEKKSARQVKAEQTIVTPRTDHTVVKSIWRDHDGGCAGVGTVGENEVYFLGIIDILVEYGIKKKMETKFKAMKHDKSTISSAEPQYYSQRFVQFVKNNVVNLKDVS